MAKSSLFNVPKSEIHVENSFSSYTDMKDEKAAEKELVKEEVDKQKKKKAEGHLKEEDFTTLRLPKNELVKLRTLCTVLGEQSSFTHRLIPILVRTYMDTVMTPDEVKLFKMLAKTQNIKLQ